MWSYRSPLWRRRVLMASVYRRRSSWCVMHGIRNSPSGWAVMIRIEARNATRWRRRTRLIIENRLNRSSGWLHSSTLCPLPFSIVRRMRSLKSFASLSRLLLGGQRVWLSFETMGFESTLWGLPRTGRSRFGLKIAIAPRLPLPLGWWSSSCRYRRSLSRSLPTNRWWRPPATGRGAIFVP